MDWFARATRIEIEHFDTYQEMVAAERKAIATEHPTFNIVGNSGRQPRQPNPDRNTLYAQRVKAAAANIAEIRRLQQQMPVYPLLNTKPL
jgi:hypothetical protein